MSCSYLIDLIIVVGNAYVILIVNRRMALPECDITAMPVR
jgi:hypothetical protein